MTTVNAAVTSQPGAAPSPNAEESNVAPPHSTELNSFEKKMVCISKMCYPCTWPCTIRLLQEYQRGVLFRLGRVQDGVVGPGCFCILPFVDNMRTIDIREQVYDIPWQDVLTKDSLTVRVNAVVYFRIVEPLSSIVNIKNVLEATQLLAQTSLRNAIGGYDLTEILGSRSEIAREIEKVVDRGTDPWGVKISRVELKDLQLPETLQRAMAKEAEATREAKAKEIAAQGEKNASSILAEAGEELEAHPISIQLRYMQTLQSISQENNSTVVFPVPVDFINGVLNKTKPRRDEEFV